MLEQGLTFEEAWSMCERPAVEPRVATGPTGPVPKRCGLVRHGKT
jgi:hypothetical protein